MKVTKFTINWPVFLFFVFSVVGAFLLHPVLGLAVFLGWVLATFRIEFE